HSAAAHPVAGPKTGVAAASVIPVAAEALPDPFPGEFRLHRLLGRGGFGCVWLADDLHLGRAVALKTFPVSPDLARATEQLLALENEAHILAQLHHPNVVQVHA